MPELPEVETIKTAIAKAIGCCRIKKITIRNAKLRIAVPAELVKLSEGTTINNYRRIAKYIVIDLNNGFSLIWHMGMSGKVKICSTPPSDLDKHDHIIIETENGVLIYNDPRRFGLLTICPTIDLGQHSCFKNTGIDPFAKEFTAEYLFAQLQKRKKIAIKIALLDQKIVAGIGNIYASEILYESTISPLRESGKVTAKECIALVDNTRKVLQKAIAAGGSTLRDYKKPDGSLGYFQNMHCVYNKTGQKCPNCICDIDKTGGIKKIVQGGRSTFYCERLQK